MGGSPRRAKPQPRVEEQEQNAKDTKPKKAKDPIRSRTRGGLSMNFQEVEDNRNNNNGGGLGGVRNPLGGNRA